MARKSLLACGLASSLLYVAMNVFVPMQWDAYSSFSQTISELSAIDAPTRSVWVPLGIVYTFWSWMVVSAYGTSKNQWVWAVAANEAGKSAPASVGLLWAIS